MSRQVSIAFRRSPLPDARTMPARMYGRLQSPLPFGVHRFPTSDSSAGAVTRFEVSIAFRRSPLPDPTSARRSLQDYVESPLPFGVHRFTDAASVAAIRRLDPSVSIAFRRSPLPDTPSVTRLCRMRSAGSPLPFGVHRFPTSTRVRRYVRPSETVSIAFRRSPLPDDGRYSAGNSEHSSLHCLSAFTASRRWPCFDIRSVHNRVSIAFRRSPLPATSASCVMREHLAVVSIAFRRSPLPDMPTMHRRQPSRCAVSIAFRRSPLPDQPVLMPRSVMIERSSLHCLSAFTASRLSQRQRSVTLSACTSPLPFGVHRFPTDNRSLGRTSQRLESPLPFGVHRFPTRDSEHHRRLSYGLHCLSAFTASPTGDGQSPLPFGFTLSGI